MGYGFDLTDIKTGHRKDQIIRNLVNPLIGEHVLRSWEKSTSTSLLLFP